MLVFQGLLKHLWDPGAVGERARRGAANCLLLPQLSLPNSSDLSSPNSTSTPASPSSSSDPTPSSAPSTPPSSSSTPPPSSPVNVRHQTINWELFITKQVFINNPVKTPIMLIMLIILFLDFRFSFYFS